MDEHRFREVLMSITDEINSVIHPRYNRTKTVATEAEAVAFAEGVTYVNDDTCQVVVTIPLEDGRWQVRLNLEYEDDEIEEVE